MLAPAQRKQTQTSFTSSTNFLLRGSPQQEPGRICVKSNCKCISGYLGATEIQAEGQFSNLANYFLVFGAHQPLPAEISSQSLINDLSNDDTTVL